MQCPNTPCQAARLIATQMQASGHQGSSPVRSTYSTNEGPNGEKAMNTISDLISKSCIRSWDTCFTKRYKFGNLDNDFLVIIDNMMSVSPI